jgi:hypothetical protein
MAEHEGEIASLAERHGPPCPHGSLTVCPHCDPRGFLVAYALTRNILEDYGHSDAEVEAMVDTVLSDSSEADQ